MNDFEDKLGTDGWNYDEGANPSPTRQGRRGPSSGIHGIEDASIIRHEDSRIAHSSP